MSTAQTLLLGAIAGFTIFLGLPIGRMQNVSAETKAFLAATATGVLIFLFWDVMSGAVGPTKFSRYRNSSPATPAKSADTSASTYLYAHT